MAVAVLEPAAAFEGDGRRRDDAFQRAFAERAFRDLRIGELLDMFCVLFALLAFIFVKRHSQFPYIVFTVLPVFLLLKR